MSRAARLVRGSAAAILLLALLAGVPAFLVTAVGWPLPRVMPAWDDITATFAGDLPLDADTVWKVLACVVWLAWAQLLTATIIEGAAVAGGRVAMPIRGLAHMQGLAGPLLSAAALILPSSLHIANSDAPRPISTARALIAHTEPAAHAPPDVGGGNGSAPTAPAEPTTFEHVVARRDTLWDLAERYLAPGGTTAEISSAVQRLFDLNKGRPQPDGSTLTHASIIEPGWIIRIPAAPGAPAPTSSTVLVEPGDSLWEIAEDHLGDGYRYREIFDLNAGRPQPDGETLTEPRHIEPGWQLEVPPITTATPPVPSPAAPTTTPPDPSPPPAPPAIPTPPTTPADSAPPAEPVPTTAAPAGDTGSQRPAAEEPSDDDTASLIGVLGIAGTLLGTGLGTLIAVRRRRQRARRQPGTEPPPIPASAAQLVDALADVDVDYGLGVDHALRTLGHALGERASVPVPIVATLDGSNIDILLDRAETDPPPPWSPVAGGRIWRAQVEARSDEPDAGPAWLPTFVSIGALDTGGMLLNLEAAGAAAIAGDEPATALARSIVVELATTPLADVAAIHVVGDVIGDVTNLPRTRHHGDIAAALAAAEEDTAPISGALAGTGMPNAVELRCRARDEAWPPAVVVARIPNEPPASLAQLIERCHERAGVVAVLVGDCPAGAFEVRVTTDEVSIPALDLSCAPQQLDHETLEAVVEILEVAEQPSGEPLDDRPLTLFSPAEVDDADHAGGDTQKLYLHLLGPMRAEGAELSPQQLALVAYLALHPGATADALRDAIWGGQAPKRERFLNTIHELRRVVGPDILPSSTDGRYRLRHAWCDLAEADRLVAAAKVNADERAVHLRAVLELVSGPPLTFESRHRRHFTWIDLGNHQSRWERIVGDAAHELAQIALDQGDSDLARWAAERGLLASPASQALTCDLISAHLAAGDRNAAEHVVDAYGRVLEDLGYEDTPEQLQELLESRRAS